MTYHRKAFMGLSALALAVSAVHAAPTPPDGNLPRVQSETRGESSGRFYQGDLFTLILGKCGGVCTAGTCDCLSPLPTPPSNDCPPPPTTRTNTCAVGGPLAGALCRRNSQCSGCVGGHAGTACSLTAANPNTPCYESCTAGLVGQQCGGATAAVADALCNVFSTIISTGFEPPDGWDLGHSICGDEFAFGVTCNYPVTNVCLTKNHAASQNCCPDDPNVSNGWSMSPSSRHCKFPGITNVHPSSLKSSSSQHMRFQKDPLGGVPAGCTAACNGDGNCLPTACRQRYITSQAPVPQISRSIWKKDIAFSGINGSSLDELFGQDTNAGSIFASARVFWRFNGDLFVYDNVNAAYRFLGYWKDTVPNYAQFTIDFNPCENKLTYSYDNGRCGGCKNDGGTPGDPSDDTCTAANCAPLQTPDCCTGGDTGSSCVTNADCNLSLEFAYGFTPPYGDIVGPDPGPPTTDTSFASTDHFGGTIDIDNFVVTNTPCTEACCDNTTGDCQDVEAGTCETKNTYPNTKCAMLGTPGYPPACAIATGSCCDSGPRAGGVGPEGACTNGVLQADCSGSQQTWVKGGSCANVTGICHVGGGTCAQPGGCQTWPNVGMKCTVNADCNSPGFCYAGLCSPASVPGHCVYPSAGFCQNMGRCTGSPTCNPATGAGCCDPDCPNACPGATGPCLPEKQPCNAVPGGADCAFCEGCDAFPAVGCSAIGTSTGCPPPGLGLPAGTCTANAAVPCNDDVDCPAQTPPRSCIRNKGGKAGALCITDADCGIEASGCLEHKGACCEYVKGTCDDDVLEADCKGAQETWFKLATCSEIQASGECFTHLGACCDEDTFGGCAQTTENACNTVIKGVFHKLQSCSEITCVHKAIPTVSEWGIAVLTLLLLIGAKVYFGRRQASAA